MGLPIKSLYNKRFKNMSNF